MYSQNLLEPAAAHACTYNGSPLIARSEGMNYYRRCNQHIQRTMSFVREGERFITWGRGYFICSGVNFTALGDGRT